MQRLACVALSALLISPLAAMTTGAGKSASAAPPPSAKAIQALAAKFPSRAGVAPRSMPNVKSWAANTSGFRALSVKDATAYFSPDRGVVQVVPSKGAGKSLANLRAGESREQLVRRFVEGHFQLFGIRDAAAALALRGEDVDDLGMRHLRFQQVRNGVPIWGRELLAHVEANGELRSINCLLTPVAQQAVNDGFSLRPDEAAAVAEMSLEAAGVEYALGDCAAATLGYEGPQAELNYWHSAAGAPLELVYVVETRPNLLDWYRAFVRASDGEVLEWYNATAADGPATANATNLLGQSKAINTYRIGADFFLIDASRPMFVAGQTGTQLIQDAKGVIETLDLRNHDLARESSIFHVTSSSNSWSDPTSVSAHDNGAAAFEYFRQNHGRNSLDGMGGSVISIIHATEGGQGLDNAFWNGAVMVYGDGKSAFKPLARGLDVAAHEMSHGVIQHTADLEYKSQSGALNESFADVFGVLVDTDDYRMGEDVVLTSVFPSGALRDLQDPHNGASGPGQNGWQPANMGEFQNLDLSQDNGGVHVNSGIPNNAAFRVMQAIGRQDAGRIYYRALSMHLGKQSNFTDARLALERSATELFGENSTQRQAVSAAFDAVGITQGGGTQPPDDAPVTPGEQFIMVVDAGTGRPVRAVPDFSSFLQVSPNPINGRSGRPLGIDPLGEVLYFCDANSFLRGVYTDGTAEEVIDGPGSPPLSGNPWFSVAVSPSGNKLALTRDADDDKNIYIIDFGVDPAQLSAIPLRHPTSGGGEGDDIVRYADTMSWLNDQYLAYDALNEIPNPSGPARQFWDVNIVDVVSGSFYPVLPPQPEGVLVGNPSVSTRNDGILTMDYIDNSDPDHPQSQILGINLYTGDASAILVSDGFSPGFPDYSVDDGQLVFTFYDGPTPGIARVPLNANRISASGAPVVLATGAALPIWFAKGRPLPPVDGLVDFITGKGPSPGLPEANGEAPVDAADVVRTGLN